MSDSITMEISKTRNYKSGYKIHHGVWKMEGNLSDIPEQEMKWAVNENGDYIGDSRWAHRLCTKRGIKPEKISPDHNVCSIGFCEKEQKWYGWSHRAIYGFGIGDVVDSEDHLCTQVGPGNCDQNLPIGFEAKTLDDAKKMAIAFARAVS